MNLGGDRRAVKTGISNFENTPHREGQTQWRTRRVEAAVTVLLLPLIVSVTLQTLPPPPPPLSLPSLTPHSSLSLLSSSLSPSHTYSSALLKKAEEQKSAE